MDKEKAIEYTFAKACASAKATATRGRCTKDRRSFRCRMHDACLILEQPTHLIHQKRH